MTKPNKNFRRSLWVPGDQQKRIILGFCVAPLVSLVLLISVVGFFSARLAHEAATQDAELSNLGWLFLSLAVFVLVSSAITLYQAVKHSHRIAGPMYRIKESLRQIATGDRHLRIKIRDGDYLTEIVDEMNATLDALQRDGSGSEEAPQPQKELAETVTS